MNYQIVNFYEFRELGGAKDLADLKERLGRALCDHSVYGTIIIASEGFNASICAKRETISPFLSEFEQIVDTRVSPKVSFSDTSPFRKHEVRIKPEIVTLKREVDLSLGEGTHVDPAEWNRIISDPEVIVLDTRNDYEFRSGTFRNPMNPETEKFSDLPAFVESKLDPAIHKKIAMFCTGGIRCEKFAPYMKGAGFEEVFQLRGGILKYLEVVPPAEHLWDGECFVFDERITVNRSLEKGVGPDLSQRHSESGSR